MQTTNIHGMIVKYNKVYMSLDVYFVFSGNHGFSDDESIDPSIQTCKSPSNLGPIDHNPGPRAIDHNPGPRARLSDHIHISFISFISPSNFNRIPSPNNENPSRPRNRNRSDRIERTWTQHPGPTSFWELVMVEHSWLLCLRTCWKHTVDGRNPAPVTVNLKQLPNLNVFFRSRNIN